jgi:hypothetical protein
MTRKIRIISLSKVKRVFVVSLVALLCFSFMFAVAEAYSVAFSYEGWGIRGKPSLGATYLPESQLVMIDHTQERDYPGLESSMTVSIQRKNWLGVWSTVKSKTWNNDVYGVQWYTSLDQGTYRLYFSSKSELNAQACYCRYIQQINCNFSDVVGEIMFNISLTCHASSI